MVPSHKLQCLGSMRLDWSKLPEDVLRLILERLRHPDFHRARAVCLAWSRVWGECVHKPNQVPWLILFPDPAQSRRSCLLYNPQEEEKVYTIQDLGVDPCLASCGTWLLMSDPLLNLYIMNALTLERINLLPMESQRHRCCFVGSFLSKASISKAAMRGFSMDKAVLWIDEKTKDYLVAWSWGDNTQMALYKRGDCVWRQIPLIARCSDLVFKDHKLYMYGEDGNIIIWNVSGEIPTKANLYPPFHFHLGVLYSPPSSGAYLPHFIDWMSKIVVTNSGDVLMVAIVLKRDLTWHFRVYKFNSANNDWEQTVTLGDQAVILDLGTTVQASADIQGITRNSIYFSGLPYSEKDIFIFNLSSQKVQRLSASPISSRPYSDARWLFPT